MENSKAKESLSSFLSLETDKKKVVVTHHPLSMNAIAEKYKRYGVANFFFASDMERHVVDKVDLCISGHTHTPHDFTVGNTRFYSNPIGYYGENEQVNTLSLIEI